MKEHPDANDTLRAEGVEALRERHDRARRTSNGPGEADTGGWRFHGDEDPAPTAWLIKNILPETGAGLIAGQWGTYKTTVALDLSVSVMTGTPFAERFAVKRRGGVAYLALEGIGGLPSRLTRDRAQRADAREALPFVYRSDCPALSAAGRARQAHRHGRGRRQGMRDRFDIPTVLVFVDTVVTAAGYSKIRRRQRRGNRAAHHVGAVGTVAAHRRAGGRDRPFRQGHRDRHARLVGEGRPRRRGAGAAGRPASSTAPSPTPGWRCASCATATAGSNYRSRRRPWRSAPMPTATRSPGW